MKALVIVNPASRHGSRLTRERIAAELPGAEVVVTRAAGDALNVAAEAARNGFTPIVAAGGDGTVNEVLNGIADTGAVLGVIPVGTANVLARELGLPIRDLGRCADAIRAGATRRLDVGSANGRRFLLMAGVGFDARVVEGVGGSTKARLGVVAYIARILALMPTYRAPTLSVRADGALAFAGPAMLAVVSNCSRYALNLKLTPDALPDDGLLDLCVLPTSGARQMKILVPALYALGHRSAEYRGFVRVTGREFEIAADPPSGIQVDGERAEDTPAIIRVIPSAQVVLVP